MDHPRTCGEKPLVNRQLSAALGSPPHMRGKAPCPPPISTARRITPAHAGKSRPEDRQTNQLRDHPRTCGEKVVNGQTVEVTEGSPPHMRGKVPQNP